MIIDYLEEFTPGAGQELSADAASEYCVDFVQKSPTTGLDYGQPVAVFTVKEDVTGTLTIKLQDCDTSNGSFEDCASAVALESPVAGTIVQIPIPPHHKRFLQAYFSGASAGTVHGAIVSGVQDNEGFEQAASVDNAFTGGE